MNLLKQLLEISERRQLKKRNQREFDEATVCMCGKPAVIKVQSRYRTPYCPTWGRCEEHKGVPLDHPWINTGSGFYPAEDVTRSTLDGSPAAPEWPIIVEHIEATE
jgi:hypothetical protein